MKAIIAANAANDQPVLINLGAIKYAEPLGNQTRVSFMGGGDKVILKMSFMEFLKAIETWRLE